LTVRTIRAVALFVLLLVPAIMPIAGARDGGAVYLDEQGRFLFSIPQGWTVADLLDPGPTAVALDTADPWGSFAVATEGQMPGMSLDAYAGDAAERVRRNLDNARILPDGIQPYALGGEPARAFVVQGRQQGRDVDIFGVVAFHGATVYTLIFTTRPADFDAYLDGEQTVLDSFIFLG